jgi:hypothetical protein
MFINPVKKAENTNQSKPEKSGLIQIPKAITNSRLLLTGSSRLTDPKPTKYC